MIQRQKAEWLVDYIETNDFTVAKVSVNSVAMSYLAKWELGIIHQRRLELFSEPLQSKVDIEAAVVERLPEQLNLRR